MATLFALINLASLVAFVIGLIDPKKVLLGENRTRRKSSEIYLSAFVISFIAMGITTPRKPDEVFQPPPIAEAKPTPTPEATPAPAPTPVEAAPTPTPEFVTFDPAVCKTGNYLPVNGASIALYTTCQYLNTDALKLDAVVAVTGANGSNDPSVLELQSEAGFAGITWRDYYSEKKDRDVCVEYKDQSVSCYKFAVEPDEQPGAQP